MKYEIYMDGYTVNGNSSGPVYVGSAEGDSLKEAVKNWYDKNGTPEDFKYLDKDYSSYWGCKFFTISRGHQ